VNDVSPVQRNSSEIKRDLRRRRSELQENLKGLLRGRKTRSGDSSRSKGPSGPNGAKMPLLSIAASAAMVGVLLMSRRLWPLRVAGRLVGLAAPVVVPALVRRIAGRESAN